MKRRIKHFIQNHNSIYEMLFTLYSRIMSLLCFFTPIKEKRMLFCSLSGRNFDDSPKAIYDEVINRSEFNDWELIWAFKEPDHFSIPRGRCIRFGDLNYWKTLFSSKVWVGNGGIDNGLDLVPSRRIVVNTWHGSVLKKSEGEENSNAVLQNYRNNKKLDTKTIRCAQNDFDIETYVRLFKASPECFLKNGLPRNDILLKYTDEDKMRVRETLGIPRDKKVILYMPTYREYWVNEYFQRYMALPLSMNKWDQMLGDRYVFLLRAHYAITAALDFKRGSFCKDVSKYEPLSELYLVADILVTDYSSCFFDYAILEKPILCFAYDRSEYEMKRGLYLRLEEVMPCGVFIDEDNLISKILNMDYSLECKKISLLKRKMLPYCNGEGSKAVVDKVLKSIDGGVV